MGLWQDLGISSSTGILVLIGLYFIIKWAVRRAVKDACEEIYERIYGKELPSLYPPSTDSAEATEEK